MKAKLLLIPVILILLVSLVSAANVTDSTGNDMATNHGGDSNWRGYVINPNKDITIWNVTVAVEMNADTNCSIHYPWNNVTPMVTSGFKGADTIVTFTDGVDLTSGLDYCIGCGAYSGSAYKDTTPAAYPIGGTNLDFVNYSICNLGSSTTSDAFNVETIISEETVDPDNITVTLNSPSDNDHDSIATTNFTWNVTSTNSLTNCSLWLNSTGAWSLNTTNTSTVSTTVTNGITQNITEGVYLWNIQCCDNLGECSWASANYTFVIDTTSPIITWTLPANDNSTVLDSNTNSSVLISDDNLYSYYFNITYPNGTTAFNWSNTSLTGSTSKTIIHLINTSTLSGPMLATTKVCDSHTKNSIDVRASKRSNELRFDGVKVYLQTKTDTSRYDYTQLSDRYKFDFVTRKASNTQSFVVESLNYIDILKNTGYSGHLVTGDKWIDFVMPGTTAKVKRITPYKVVVTVTNSKAVSEWSFESVGELNCVTETREFMVVNHTHNHPTQVLSGSTHSYYFNMSYNSSYITSNSVTLILNNTRYAMTETLGSDLAQYTVAVGIQNVTSNVNYSVIYEYEVNGAYTNVTGTNTSVYVPAIDNCSDYSTRWVNFTLRDELNSSILSGDLDYLFEYVSGTYSGVYDGSSEGRTNFSFCIYPAWANFTTDIFLQYSVTGYDDRDYVSDNYRADNVTENINLYALTSGLATDVTIHVVDESDNDLANVFIVAERWDIPTNTYLQVETEYTDSDGNAILDLTLGSQYYRFSFYQSGVLQLQTTRFKIFSTSLEYILRDDTTSRLGEWVTISNAMTHSLTYSNSTNLVLFTWSGAPSIVSNVCLNVTSANLTRYYNNCSSSASGSLNFTITAFNISYTATGFVTTTTGYNFVLEVLGIDTRTDWRTWGVNLSLTLALLIYLVIALLGLSVGLHYRTATNTTVIMGGLALGVLYWFEILPLSWPTIVSILAVSVITLFIINKREAAA